MRPGPLRTVAVTGLLVVATAVLWWLVFPADWSVVPTADEQTYASPVSAAHWTAAAVGLTLLAAAGGYAGGVLVAVVGVALPALALFCYRSATAEVIGANLWVVGALFLAPALVAGAAAAAVLGRLARRRMDRRAAEAP
jgi:hypothetical protein